MSAFIVALIFAIGLAGWVWSKVGMRTGNADPKSIFLTALGAGVMGFVVLFTLLKFGLGF